MNEFFRAEDTSGEDREPAPSEARADTTSEPPDPGHALSLMELFDARWGDRLVPVTPPGCEIPPSSKIDPKHRGKAQVALGPAGWFGGDVNDPKFRCLDYATAKLWRDEWGANVGFVVGDGYAVLDNDQGEILDAIIVRVCLKVLGPTVKLLRRFVASPEHMRSAFPLQVVDFIGDPARVGNQTLKFECTGRKSELQVLAQSKQLVVAGVHPGTGKPYVLNKRVASLADIPLVEQEQFKRIIEGVIAEMQAHGWALVSGGAGTGPGTSPGAGAGKADPANFEEVAWILERLPNRDAESGQETDWDKFISVYEEWIKFLYAIFGALGDAPEVRALAVGWSDGRAQSRQKSEDTWASVIRQPVRSGIGHLRRLARRFIGAEYTALGFPDDDADTLPPEDDSEADEMDEALLASRMPAIDPKAFYGPLKEVVEAATKNSEATKIGVALQTIAHTALCLRPFCIPLGDGPICLNLFLLQIGLSSIARKGTSSAFADNFVGPAIQALAQELRQSSSGIALDCAAREDARRAVEEAELAVDRARLLTDANAAEPATRVAALKTEKADAENTIAGDKSKLAAKLYALATRKATRKPSGKKKRGSPSWSRSSGTQKQSTSASQPCLQIAPPRLPPPMRRWRRPKRTRRRSLRPKRQSLGMNCS